MAAPSRFAVRPTPGAARSRSRRMVSCDGFRCRTGSAHGAVETSSVAPLLTPSDRLKEQRERRKPAAQTRRSPWNSLAGLGPAVAGSSSPAATQAAVPRCSVKARPLPVQSSPNPRAYTICGTGRGPTTRVAWDRRRAPVARKAAGLSTSPSSLRRIGGRSRFGGGASPPTIRNIGCLGKSTA